MPAARNLAAALAAHAPGDAVADALLTTYGVDPTRINQAWMAEPTRAAQLAGRGPDWARALAVNPHVREELLAELAENENELVRLSVATNLNASATLRLRMLQALLDTGCTEQQWMISTICDLLPAADWVPLLLEPGRDVEMVRDMLTRWARTQTAASHDEQLLPVVQEAATARPSLAQVRTLLGALAAHGVTGALPALDAGTNPTGDVDPGVLRDYLTGLAQRLHEWTPDVAAWVVAAAATQKAHLVPMPSRHRDTAPMDPATAAVLAGSDSDLCAHALLTSSSPHVSLGDGAVAFARRCAGGSVRVQTALLGHPGLVSLLDAGTLTSVLMSTRIEQVDAKALLALPVAVHLPQPLLVRLLEQCSYAGLAAWICGAWPIAPTDELVRLVAVRRFRDSAGVDAALERFLTRVLKELETMQDTPSPDLPAAHGPEGAPAQAGPVVDEVMRLIPGRAVLTLAAAGRPSCVHYLARRLRDRFGDNALAWTAFLAVADEYEGDDLEELLDVAEALLHQPGPTGAS